MVTNRKSASRSRCEGCRELASWSGQGLREVPDPSVPGHVPEVGLECSCSDEDEVTLAYRESRADVPEVSL